VSAQHCVQHCGTSRFRIRGTRHGSRLVLGVRDALVRAVSILRKPRKIGLARNLCFGVPMAPTGDSRHPM
jgi:hypothetical protein